MLKFVSSVHVRVLVVSFCATLTVQCISVGERATFVATTVASVSLPARPGDALGGREVLASVQGKPLVEREEVLAGEVLRGNVPTAMRMLVPIRLVVKMPDQNVLPGTAWVLPDYLSVGSDDDFVRVPLSLPAAQRIATALGLSLPTVPIVNAIYEQANVRLAPKTLPPSAQMTSIDYVLRHEKLVSDQLAARSAPNSRDLLLAGHKKDVVLVKKNATAARRRVAIFGWHRGVNQPIQPLSTVHGENYVDYSHGIRLVSPAIRVETTPPTTVFIDADDVEIGPAPLQVQELVLVSKDPF